MQRAKSKTLSIGVLVLTLIVGLFGGFVGGYVTRDTGNFFPTILTTQSNPQPAISVNSTPTNLESLIKQITPSVVNITSATQSSDYFGRPQSAQSIGTGMVITTNGYILTSKHIVSGGSGPVSVQTTDRKQYSAEVTALDPNNDLAILKINATNLTPVRLGDSSLVLLGQPVIAIGNTLGQFQNTVTQGIISGLNRSISAGDSMYSQESLTDLLQTDAAINPGNSGGPLVDQKSGTVIGISTAGSISAQSIGFVIPINQAKTFINNHVTGPPFK